jgi:hypothetical protein
VTERTPWHSAACALFVLVLAFGSSRMASAQSDAPYVPAKGDEPESALAWWWKHTTPVPIVFYTPENQLGFGGGVMTTYALPGAWADRPSNVLLYGVYTTRNQTIVGASHEQRFADDRHVLIQEFRFIDWPDRFYGFGNDTQASDREDYTDHYLQLESEYQYRLLSRLYVGVRHQLRSSETRDVEGAGTLDTQRPRGVGHLVWSGLGPLLLWDSRAGLFWPTGGSLLRADATLFQPAFGADFRATLLRLDLRHYQPLWLDHVLALRLFVAGALGSLPFQLLPALGGSQLFRGWFLGRLRDRTLAAVEAEYRMVFSTRFSGVVFGSVGRVAAELSALSPKDLRAAGGLGIRFAVRPENRANFRLDFAYGDEPYVYFQFREAF